MPHAAMDNIDDRGFLGSLRCPTDGQALRTYVLRQDAGAVLEGVLHCPSCREYHAVIEGIARFAGRGTVDTHRDIALLDAHEGRLVEMDREALGNARARLEAIGREVAGSWERDEMLYWEDYYGGLLETGPARRPSFDRLIPRQRHILGLIPPATTPQAILELGCGIPATLASSAWFLENRSYTGTDLSFNALRAARRVLPGNYVMCDAKALPFAPGGYDVLLSFGVLHHLPERERALEYLMSMLRPGGWIGLSEKLLTSQRLRRSPLIGLLKRMFLKASRGEGHHEYVDGERLLDILGKRCPEVHPHYEYSIVRDALVMLLQNRMGINRRFLTEAIIRADGAAIAALGSRVTGFEPKGLLAVARKG